MAISIIIGIVGYGFYIHHYVSIEPFQGEPQDNIDIFRTSPAIDKFYTMYEKYGITIADMSEGQIKYAFVTTDGENRHVTFGIKYFDGKSSDFYHTCYQIEPKERIFLEKNYIEQDCFELTEPYNKQ